MNEKEIEEEIEKLEKEIIEYLEVDDKRTASAKRRKIKTLQDKLELEKAKQYEKLYKKAISFIKQKGFMYEFNNFKEEN